jgi:REP element-mobilizing transposase RayT
MKSIREKSHRLPDEYYRGYRTTAITATLENRTPAFVDAAIVNAMADRLIEASTCYRCTVDLYLFMPDHGHFLISTIDAEGDVLAAMKRFKQRSGYWLAHNTPGVRWQKDFYDHILRRDDECEKHVRYILANPVRAGMVIDWKDYPYRGSMKYDLESWIVP